MCAQFTHFDLLTNRLSLLYLQGGPKMAPFIVRFITSTNINRFSKFFYYQNQKTICNKTVTINLTTPQICRYTILWNVRRCTQAGYAIDQLRDQLWSSLACGPQQPELKSRRLCCFRCPSTDGLSMLTIHDSRPAKESDCHLVEQTAAAFG